MPTTDISLTAHQQTEAYHLLALINYEFQSDPTSVQCFDLRIVQRVKDLVDAVKPGQYTEE